MPPDRDHVPSRREITQFFEATTDAVVFLDRNYHFTFLNRRAYELLSPRGNVLGSNLYEMFPDAVYDNSPFVENYRKSMDGVPAAFEAYYPAPLNIWLRIHSYPADDGIMIFFRDFTEEKLAAEVLQQKIVEVERQRAEIETLYQTAPIGLALFDTEEFRYLRLNNRQAAFFELPPERIVGQVVTDLAPIEGLRELFEQVIQGKPVINHPLEGTLATDPDPDNHRHWTVSYFPVYGPDGSVKAITTASLEVTQQKKAAEALIQSEKLAVVGRLATSIAHEMNNPLEAVTNLIYLAQRTEDAHDVRQLLKTAEQELHRVSAIASQTLRFHKQASNSQEISTDDLIRNVLTIYQGRIVNSGAQVSTRYNAHASVCCGQLG